MGLCSRVRSTTTSTHTAKAHDEHFSTFTTDTEQRFQNDLAAIEPDHRCDDRHDRPSNHAGDISMGRKRWQLPNGAAFLLHGHPLGAGIVSVLLWAPFGSSGHLPAGRR